MAGSWCSVLTGLALFLLPFLLLGVVLVLLVRFALLELELRILRGELCMKLLKPTLPTTLVKSLNDRRLLLLMAVEMDLLVELAPVLRVFSVLVRGAWVLGVGLVEGAREGLLRRLLLPGLVPDVLVLFARKCLNDCSVVSTRLETVSLRLVIVLLRLTELTCMYIRLICLSVLKYSVVTTSLMWRPHVVSTVVCLFRENEI